MGEIITVTVIIIGNIILDISDRYSQFCLTEFSFETNLPTKVIVCDFSRFSEEDFKSELAKVDWALILSRTQENIDVAFSKINNKRNKLVNKHAC